MCKAKARTPKPSQRATDCKDPHPLKFGSPRKVALKVCEYSHEAPSKQQHQPNNTHIITPPPHQIKAPPRNCRNCVATYRGSSSKTPNSFNLVVTEGAESEGGVWSVLTPSKLSQLHPQIDTLSERDTPPRLPKVRAKQGTWFPHRFFQILGEDDDPPMPLRPPPPFAFRPIVFIFTIIITSIY